MNSRRYRIERLSQKIGMTDVAQMTQSGANRDDQSTEITAGNVTLAPFVEHVEQQFPLLFRRTVGQQRHATEELLQVNRDRWQTNMPGVANARENAQRGQRRTSLEMWPCLPLVKALKMRSPKSYGT